MMYYDPMLMCHECPYCGGVLDDDGVYYICPQCGTDLD